MQDEQSHLPCRFITVMQELQIRRFDLQPQFKVKVIQQAGQIIQKVVSYLWEGRPAHLRQPLEKRLTIPSIFFQILP
jgi:NAD-dependent DNA ligase